MSAGEASPRSTIRMASTARIKGKPEMVSRTLERRQTRREGRGKMRLTHIRHEESVDLVERDEMQEEDKSS